MKAILLEALQQVTTDALVTKDHANAMAEELEEALSEMGFILVRVEDHD